MRRTPVLGALLLAAICMACATRSSLPAGAELIPADATFAVSVDVPAVLSSDLYKRYKANESVFGRNRLNFYKFAEATGLDPSKDVSRVLFIARAGTHGLDEMSALVEGTFDGRKVHDFLATSGMPSRKVAGVDIFEFVVIEDRCRFCLAVIDSSTAAFGDSETLEKIARIKSGADAPLSAGSGAGRLLRRVGREADAWGILRADDLRQSLAGVLRRLSANSSALSALGPIHEAAFSLDTAEPMRLLVEMTASSEEDAMLVADVLKGAESLGRLALKEARPELGRVMSDLSVEADTGVVRVSASIPSSDIDAVTQVLGLNLWGPGRLNPSAQSQSQTSPSGAETPPPSEPDGPLHHR